MSYNFYLKQGDLLPAYQVVLTDTNGDAEDLSGFSGFVFRYKLPGGSTILQEVATVDDAANGVVHHSWVAGDSDTVGQINGEFVGTKGGKEQTWPSVNYAEIWVSKELA